MWIPSALPNGSFRFRWASETKPLESRGISRFGQIVDLSLSIKMQTYAPKDLLQHEIFYLGKCLAYMVVRHYAEIDYSRLSRILRVPVEEPLCEIDASRLYNLVYETAWQAGLR